MFCTDSLVDVSLQFALKAFQHIPTENIHVVRLGYFVPEVLELDRRIRPALRQQDRYTFTTNRNTRMFSLYRFGRGRNKITPDFEKSSRIRQIMRHECRKRSGYIQRDIAPLSDGGSNIHTMRLQPLKKTLSVCFGCDNDYRIPGLQTSFDK